MLFNPPVRTNEPPHHIPYGIAMLGAVLDREGYELAVGDNNAYRMSQEQALEEVKDEGKKHGEFDWFGFGGLITSYSWNQEMITRVRKEYPKTPIIAGGGWFSSLPNEILKWNPEISVGVYGEAEETILDLVKHYDTNAKSFFDLKDVKGIYYREGKKVYKTQPRPAIEDLDTLPYPAWNLLALDEYFRWSPLPLSPEALRATRRIDVIGERGCPNACRFCFHWLCDDKHRVRWNSAKYLVDMIKTLRLKYAVDFISILDENFMANEDRTEEFCDLFEEEGLSQAIHWGCLGDVRHARPSMLAKMRRSGCSYISYGGESANQRMLDAMNKGTTVEQNMEAVQCTARENINPIMTFIIGYPGETVQSVIDTVNFWVQHMIACDAFLIQPYPGSKLYDEVKPKILQQYNGDLEAWVKMLGDATDFSVNLTDFSTPELLGMKELARLRNVRELERFKKQRGEK